MAEWFKAAVLKTVVPCERDRGFESYSLRQNQRAVESLLGEMAEKAEGGRLLSDCPAKKRDRGFESLSLRQK